MTFDLFLIDNWDELFLCHAMIEMYALYSFQNWNIFVEVVNGCGAYLLSESHVQALCNTVVCEVGRALPYMKNMIQQLNMPQLWFADRMPWPLTAIPNIGERFLAAMFVDTFYDMNRVLLWAEWSDFSCYLMQAYDFFTTFSWLMPNDSCPMNGRETTLSQHTSCPQPLQKTFFNTLKNSFFTVTKWTIQKVPYLLLFIFT